jgi:ATP-binding protein involved in chromosome partitioning
VCDHPGIFEIHKLTLSLCPLTRAKKSMYFSENQIVEVLLKIIHPALGKDIITLDLIRDLHTSDGKISFTLLFRNPNDPMRASIQKACKRFLREHLHQDLDIEIALESEVKPETKTEKSYLPMVKNIIAVASGKGGVGKSTVAVNLAIAFARAGAKVGLIDADIFGPSIPKMLGVEKEQPAVKRVDGKDIIIPVDRYGIKILSIGFFVNPADATIWRGPMASSAFQQLLGDTEWGELDYVFVDLPPGTSDIHLTLVQTVAVTGVVIVSTPQDVALADVIKGINMFRNPTIQVPILGLIENMAWFTPEELPENRYYIFGQEGCKKLATASGIPFLGQIPLVQGIREGGDSGEPVVLRNNPAGEAFKSVADNLAIEIVRRNTEQNPTLKVNLSGSRKKN